MPKVTQLGFEFKPFTSEASSLAPCYTPSKKENFTIQVTFKN